MRRPLILLSAASLALAAVLGVACNKTTIHESGDDDDAGESSNNNTDNNTDNTSTDDGTNEAGITTQVTGLPCDVQAVLENNCTVCHQSTNAYDAGTIAPPLVTYDDLKMMATADPTQTRAALAVQYMTAHTMPVPPAEPVDPTEIATVSSWIDAGYPQNTTACEDQIRPDGGTGDGGMGDGGLDAGVDAGGYDGGCLNGAWTMGNTKSPLMRPGEACIACHTVVKGPKYTFAGTVFPHDREPNDCNGDPNPIMVTITDVNNKSITIPTNTVGSFMVNNQTLKAPFHAKITQGNNTREMVGPLSGGDCNGCHTPTGASGAPGRILTPVAQ